MSYIIVTPTRGDRFELMDHCSRQVKRFENSFETHLWINYKPNSDKPDLKERIKYGYDEAVKMGVDFVVIIEDDDAYPKDYLSKVVAQFDKSDFIGCEFSYYYNMKNRTWDKLVHKGRSSLYTTAFRVSAMKNFAWHRADDVFLDINIWNYAKRFRRTFIDAGAIGIKGHGFGLTGGNGHKMVMRNKDIDLSWLKSRVDEESFNFYSRLAL
jgi:hypothetical protein